MKRIIPFLVLAFGLAACQDQGPTSPADSPQLAKQKPCTPWPSCKDGDVVESASGDSRIINEERRRRFQFTAERYTDETVAGEWQSHNRFFAPRRILRDHGDVTCFQIQENQAWVGGTHAWEGTLYDIVWRVIDGDLEGQFGYQDQTSLACHVAGPERPTHPCAGLHVYATAQAYCESMPALPEVVPIDGGFITLQPETP
jgi:hypothetical protein